MTRSFDYRSFLFGTLLAFSAAGVIGLLGGCAEAGKKHETIKTEMTGKWNRARLGVTYQLAQQQYEAGDYDKCRQTLAQAGSLNTPYAPLNVLTAKLELEKGNLEIAAANLKIAQQLDPANPDAYYFMGVVFQRWQNAQSAADFYRQAWERKSSEVTYLLALVEMQITMGQIDEAQKLLEDKLAFFEQTAAVRVALGRTYALQGQHEKACKLYRDAVILSPDDLSLRQTYAESLYTTAKYSEALPILEDLRKNPAITDRDNITIVLGQTLLNLHRTREARGCFQELTQNNPSNITALLGLGRVYLQDNDPVQALQTSAHVLKLEPDNSQALILQALAQQKQHRWADSAATLTHAQKLAPKDSTVLCMLGLTSQNLGQPERAAAFFEQARAANPQDTWAAELLAALKPPAKD